MIKITIITCTYNAETTIKRTLDSVLMQSYPYVEHLIIDGCSKDGTVSFAEQYKQQSNNANNGHEISIISEKDNGLYDAMNKGLKLASGDYLVYLNAGDCLPEEDTLEKIASAIKGNILPGVIFGDTDIVNEEGQFIRHRRLAPSKDTTWRSFKKGMLICHQSFYALTSIARQTPYNNAEYRLSADVDWCISVMKQSEQEGRTLCYVPAVVTNYLEGGMSVVNHRASLIERFKIMKHHYGLFTTIGMHCWFIARAILKK